MTTLERKHLIDILVQNYIYEKEQNKIWQRERSQAYTLATGKLQGVCMALRLELEETKNCLTIFTASKKKIITKITKE
jgi:hypothetical protein